MDEFHRRLAGILAADVVGYSAMIGKDEAATLARVRSLRTEIVEPLVVAHSGRLFKTTGDGFLAAFASTVEGLRCAIAIQTRLRSDPDGLRLRTGLHQGEVVAEGDDLLGDGVIIAARLEPLAEPGGICISGRVREDAAGKLTLEVDDLGTPELKNITTRLQVFRVRLGRTEHPSLRLPDKPSLVVLPFQNMSGDPEQEYFADGMVEEITTALARVRSLFVIARNSAFTYKGRAVDVRQVGRELGVRYVLEGSVRKAGERLRITSQLVDAATGSHVWADRFDGTLADVFDLQDLVAARVVAAIRPNLLKAEVERAQRKPTESLQAYDYVLRALPLLRRRGRADLIEVESLLRRAISIDPDYALARVNLALCRFNMVSQNWVDHSPREIAEQARAAVQLDGTDPEILRGAGSLIALAGGDMAGGIAIVNKSIELNPNSAIALQTLGSLYAYAGDKEAAIACFESSVRLSPLDRSLDYYLGYAMAHFTSGDYEATIEWTGEMLQQVPNHAASHRYRAASLGLLGRLEEGRAVVQRLLELVPDFTITRARRHIELELNNPFKNPGVADALYEGLRRCGVPE
jgi:adenylate cyclase